MGARWLTRSSFLTRLCIALGRRWEQTINMVTELWQLEVSEVNQKHTFGAQKVSFLYLPLQQEENPKFHRKPVEQYPLVQKDIFIVATAFILAILNNCKLGELVDFRNGSHSCDSLQWDSEHYQGYVTWPQNQCKPLILSHHLCIRGGGEFLALSYSHWNKECILPLCLGTTK